MTNSSSDKMGIIQAVYQAWVHQHGEVTGITGLEIDEILRSIAETVSAAGFDSGNSRVAAVLDVSGHVVDVVSNDVVLHRHGLLAIVELQAPPGSKTDWPPDDAEKRWLCQEARLILVAFPQGAESSPAVWVL